MNKQLMVKTNSGVQKQRQKTQLHNQSAKYHIFRVINSNKIENAEHLSIDLKFLNENANI